MNYFKSSLILFSILLFTLTACRAQNVWSRKADFGGLARHHAAGFSIGNKGYLGTGMLADDTTTTNDFWSWNQSTNTWTQVANLPAFSRWGASGFTINGIGYLGFGFNGANSLTDLWAYDTLANTWTAKTGLPSNPRYGSFNFVIGDSVVYLGAGSAHQLPYLNDFWQYSPVTDSWTKKADLPSVGKVHGAAFALNGIGYAGGGYASDGSFMNDFWQYDPTLDSWTAKATIPGHRRSGPACFALNGSGYFGFGVDSSNASLADLYQYDNMADTWSLVTSAFPDSARQGAVSFIIGNKAYIGTGATIFQPGQIPPVYDTKSFWQFGPLNTNVPVISYIELLTLYPNPGAGVLNILLPSPASIAVYNVLGQEVFSTDLKKGTSTIDVSRFSNGDYFLTANRGNKILEGRFKVIH